MIPLPSSFAVKPPDPYVFKSPVKRALVRWADTIGSFFLRHPEQPVPWASLKRIAVLRLDHLGDVLLCLPALKALRQGAPAARIDFIVGPWGKEAVEMAGLADRILVFEAPWFTRPPSGGFWGASRGLAGLLKEGGYEAVVDFRGDVRHAWAAYSAGIPVRVGQVLTGGKFLLTHPANYDSSLHEVEQNLSLLRQAGMPVNPDASWPAFSVGERDVRSAMEAGRELGLAQKIIAFHPFPATPAKRWPVERWARLIDALPEGFDVVMIGVHGDKPYLDEIQGACQRKTFSVAGRLGLPGLAAFLRQCRLFIGVDSGPAHIAAAVGIPVVSLFSGTNRTVQWRPWGGKVRALQKKTECSPCERRECPFDNECMKRIEVSDVLSAAKLCLSDGLSSNG